MTNFYVSLMLITATTVGKIILSSSVGMVVMRYFDHPESSVKGLSFIAMRVALPCLLFTNLCLNVTWEQLSKFYWAPLFSVIAMSLGSLFSLLVRRLLTEEYRYVVFLSCTFPNALAYPVSILLNLKGIPWFTGQAVIDAQSYAFLYNLSCNIGLYSIGEPIVAWAKQKEVMIEDAAREAAEAAVQRQHLLDMDATPNEVAAFENRSFAYPFESPRRASIEEALPGPQSPAAPSPSSSPAGASGRRGATAREQLQWYRQTSQKDRPIMPPPGSPVIVLNDEEGSFGSGAAAAPAGKEGSPEHFKKNVIESLTNGPNLASFIAIFVALIPPLRWLVMSYVGQSLMGGMKLIGEGAIPLQLLVLGCSLVGAPKTVTVVPPVPAPVAAAAAASPAASSEPDGTVAAEVEAAAAAAVASDADMNACMRYINSVVSPQFIFTWCTVFLRLVVMPAACFLLLHLLVTSGVFPRERPFVLAMLTEILSPSAMNLSLICAMHGYHARDYSRMIFCQYVASILTTTVWLFVFVLYVERTL